MSPRRSSADKESNIRTDSVVNEGDRLIPSVGPSLDPSTDVSPVRAGTQPASAAGTSANNVTISVEKAESTDKEKFYDAKSTTLPIFGRHSMDAEIIAEPREADPQV